MSIHVKPDGKYQVNFSTGQRKPDGAMVRWFKTCKTMKAAKAQERAWENAKAAGTLFTSVETLGAWLDEWYAATVKGQKAQRTEEHYRDIIDRKIRPALGALPLVKVDATAVQRFTTGLLQDFAPRTVNQTLDLLNRAMRLAKQHRKIADNPVPDVQRPTRRAQDRPTPPSTEDVAGALETAQGSPYYAALYLGADTGMRRGEIAGLRWEHVNLADGFLDVVESRTVGMAGVIAKAPKTEAGQRRIFLSTATVDVLIDHRDRQDEHHGFFGFPAASYVFTNAKGEPAHPNVIYKEIKKLGLSVRGLRHFSATSLVEAGESIVNVQQRLGHSDPAITMRVYAHPVEAGQRRAADTMGRLLRRKADVSEMLAVAGNRS